MHALLTGCEAQVCQDDLAHALVRFGAEQQAPGTSKYVGVYYHQGMWRARICVDGKRVSVANVADELEAAEAYDVAIVKAFGSKKKCLNFDIVNYVQHLSAHPSSGPSLCVV